MKLIALVESPDHVCCRYRVQAFVPWLASDGWEVELHGLPRGPVQRWRHFARLDSADTVLLQRKLLDAVQLHHLRRHARRFVFDFDDAVLYRDSFSAKGLDSQRRLTRFRRTVAAADAVLAGNQFLADQAAQFTDPRRIHVVPTCVDPGQYPCRNGSAPSRPTQALELVWIGSPSTLQALHQARPVLEAIGRAVPGTVLKLICDRPIALNHLPVRLVPWSPQAETTQLATADLGISWLPDDLWSRGKCGLKLLQYMAAGLPIVANPVGIHCQMIEHGVNGLLAAGAEQWVQAIRSLAADPARRAAMGRHGRQTVEQRYSVQHWAPTFKQVLAG